MQSVLNVHAILSVHCMFKLHSTKNIHMFSSIQKNMVLAKSGTLIEEVIRLWQAYKPFDKWNYFAFYCYG